MDVSSTETSFGVRKGLPYTEFLDIEVGRLKENGMIKNYLKRDIHHTSCPDQIDANGVFPIIFEKVVLAFIIFVMGVITAIFTMILEILANFSVFESFFSTSGPMDNQRKTNVDKRGILITANIESTL